MYRGHEFARRTYFYHGRAYERYYRGYSYHGAFINVYAPFRYYPFGFYGWAYNPWAVPVVYPGDGPPPLGSAFTASISPHFPCMRLLRFG